MPKGMLRYFARSFGIVLGLVLIWRGTWYILDYIDMVVFGGNKIFTVVGGIVVGFLILYLPDKDLKELEKL